MNVSGIYAIRIGGRVYFGQSCNIQNRVKAHRSMLRRGVHTNPHLQRSFDLEGDASFYVVCRCEPKYLDMVEQAFLDRYVGSGCCMNIAKDAQAARRGIGHTAESKKKMSKSRRGVSKSPMSQEGRDNIRRSRIGKTMTEEAKAKISEWGKGRSKPIWFGPNMSGGNHHRSVGVVVRFDGETKEFGSIVEAARHYGVHKETFRDWVIGRRRPQRGFNRKYMGMEFELKSE